MGSFLTWLAEDPGTRWLLVFWIGASWVLYVYGGYPALLWLLSTLFGRRNPPPPPSESALPTLSMVVAAFNEVNVLDEKVRNCRCLDYPQERIDFLIGLDGSTDGSAAVACQAAAGDTRFRIFDFPVRRGKVEVLNRIVPETRGEIVLFSDANTLYEPGAVRLMVAEFSDPRVGAVCGRLILESPGATSCQEEGLYWRYETLLKLWESRLGSMVSVNGQIFAVRRGLLQPLSPDTLNEDQLRGEQILARGYDIRFEPRAVAREPVSTLAGEVGRHVRIGAGNFQSLGRVWPFRLLHRPFIWLAYLSHKVGRWTTPVALLLMLLGSATAAWRDNPLGRYLLIIQTAAYTAAALGHLLPVLRRFRLLRLWHYFVLTNIAQVRGLIQLLLGRASVTWTRAIDIEAADKRR